MFVMRRIKLFKPFVSWKSVWYTVKTLRSGQLAEGPRVKEFEEKFGQRFGFSNVISLNSGTSALDLAYELAGIREGDEVITPVLTCTATNIPLVHKKATIVFADIDRDLNISVEDVKRKITPKTKAIVFVHFGGNNRGLKELLGVCRDKNIKLIEDAAQAIASSFWGKADYTCVSLQAIKTLTAGDGGVLICKDSSDHQRAKRLRWFGYDRELKQKQGDTDLLEPGYKYHMNDIAASIALGNLESFDKILSHHNRLIAEYASYDVLAFPWFALIFSDRRNALMGFLKDNGIDSGMHHYRNDKYTIFGGRKEFPIMDELEDKYLLLPLHKDVSVSDVDYICGCIKKFNEI